jgi:hypothetical protein
VEDSWNCFLFGGAPKESVSSAKYGIRLIGIGEREKVDRLVEGLDGISGNPRFREAMVEASSSTASGCEQESVKHAAALLVGVEAVVHQLPEKARAL